MAVSVWHVRPHEDITVIIQEEISKIVNYAKVVYEAIWDETEVNWRYQAAALHRMASQPKVRRVGGAAS